MGIPPIFARNTQSILRMGGLNLKNTKTKILVLALAVCLVAVCAMGTVAYFTDRSTATNVITTGGVDIELIETAEKDGELFPFEDVSGVMPGDVVSKIVEVKNTGKNDAYVRVSVEKAITLAEGLEGKVDLSLVKLNINTEKWTEADGYYYYNEVLKPGETTAPLFTTVTFDGTMDNLYQNCTTTISVAAQATQSANNGTSALTATGWPEA